MLSKNNYDANEFERLDEDDDALDSRPILFSSSLNQKNKNDDESNKPVLEIKVCIKITETNILKLKSTNPLKKDVQTPITVSELKDIKSESQFMVASTLVEKSPILKNNFIKEDNYVEIDLSLNSYLIIPPFETIKQVLLRIVKAKDQKLVDLDDIDLNPFNTFAAAASLGFDDIALKLFTSRIAPSIDLKYIVYTLLISLESNLTKSTMVIYKLLREYILFKTDIMQQISARAKKAVDNSPDTKLLIHEDNITLLHKNHPEFTFHTSIFKKIHEAYNKEVMGENMKPSMKYNIMRVIRKRSASSFDTDYPHFYSLIYDHNQNIALHAKRATEHGTFYIYSRPGDDKIIYGDTYLGCIEGNYWGTIFEVFDNGIDEKLMAKIPSYLINKRTKIASIVYDTNIMGDVPRDFDLNFIDFLENKENKLVSVKPEYNAQRDCYTLNFFGRAKVASARNFHLVLPDDPDSIILMHGKVSKNEFNMDFRHPINMIQAFSVALVSIGKKFFVS